VPDKPPGERRGTPITSAARGPPRLQNAKWPRDVCIVSEPNPLSHPANCPPETKIGAQTSLTHQNIYKHGYLVNARQRPPAMNIHESRSDSGKV